VAEVRDKLGRYLEAMLARGGEIETRVLRRIGKPCAPVESAYRALVERGWVKELGPGLVALSGPALDLLQYIDEAFRELGRREFGAVDQYYPPVISTAVLSKVGYFASFPQSISMVVHVREDFDQIEEFRQANAGLGSFTAPAPGAIAPPEICLTPAACYHCYPSLQGKRLAGPEMVTTSVRCARYESRNVVGLDRLWAFTMREIICVGESRDVDRCRERELDLMAGIVDAWGLHGTLETASDPFFASGYATKAARQLHSELKVELRLSLEGQHAVAAASVNLHGPFFGDRFGITSADGTPAQSGCAAFGLERWVLAIFTQLGLDVARWPAALRQAVR
jgi:seryl-tRNA synthetase